MNMATNKTDSFGDLLVSYSGSQEQPGGFQLEILGQFQNQRATEPPKIIFFKEWIYVFKKMFHSVGNILDYNGSPYCVRTRGDKPGF
ncbi:MAG: hypothetical protein JXR49_19705 [Acidobacteria bacterium]|nr:hypothetical protein [Acidobacteriota bacterium]